MRFKEFFNIFLEEDSKNNTVDDEYLAAVKSGDTEKQQEMVNAAAKASGYNIGPMYHGTVDRFHAFDNKKTGRNDRGLWGRGHYFTSSKKTSESYALRQGDDIRIITAYIGLRNPLILKTGHDLIIRMPDGTNTRDWLGDNLDGSKIKEYALNKNCDGVMQFKPDGTLGDLVAYFPSQIKSADPITYDDNKNIIPLSQRFDRTKDSIFF